MAPEGTPDRRALPARFGLVRDAREPSSRSGLAARVVLVGWLERELLPTDGSGGHQATLRNDEGGNAVLEFGILGHALIDAHGGYFGAELERIVFQLLEGLGCFEKHHLAVGLAADLSADRHLAHGDPSHVTSAFVRFARAVRAAEDERALTHVRDDDVSGRGREELLDRRVLLLEQGDGVLNALYSFRSSRSLAVLLTPAARWRDDAEKQCSTHQVPQRSLVHLPPFADISVIVKPEHGRE